MDGKCRKNSEGKCSKCITHNLWDDLEQHINKFFDNVSLNDLLKQKHADMK